MALRDMVEYTNNNFGVRISGTGIGGKPLLYRVIALSSPAESDGRMEYSPVKDTLEIRKLSVIDLTDGEERLLIGPKKPDARLIPNLLDTEGLFLFNRDAPPFHLSRLWLQDETAGVRFYLGNEKLDPALRWRLESGGHRFHFYTDEYCKAYYEGI